ncbi:MAG TPA: AraC family transcriptional regulator, partial [Clostridia bacterium]|nr:AraC family transcriptional regulator [Clostridia bacterium]
DSDLSISPILMDTLLHLLEERFTKNGILGAATLGNQVAVAFEEPLPQEHAPILRELAELRHYTRNNLMLQPNMLIVSPAGQRLPETLLRTMRAWFLAPDRPKEGLGWIAGDQLRLSPLPTEEEFKAWHDQMTKSLWLLKAPEAIYEAYHAMDTARSALSRDRVAFYKACAAAAECVSGIAVAGNADGMDLAQAHLASLRHKARCPDRDHMGLAVKLLLENLDRDCTLEEAARETGFHSAYFSSLFKHWMGMGYARFGNALRMERAKCLMRANDENVGWVAEQCGYADITYFSRVFKRIVGVCPSAWRKEEP